MIKESKCCTDIMKKHFNRELLMTKDDDKDLESSTKSWTCNYVFVKGDPKVRGNCHVTRK